MKKLRWAGTKKTPRKNERSRDAKIANEIEWNGVFCRITSALLSLFQKLPFFQKRKSSSRWEAPTNRGGDVAETWEGAETQRSVTVQRWNGRIWLFRVFCRNDSFDIIIDFPVVSRSVEVRSIDFRYIDFSIDLLVGSSFFGYIHNSPNWSVTFVVSCGILSWFLADSFHFCVSL